MNKLKNYDGYKITETEWGYYVVISSTKKNYMSTYEYDGACGTKEEVEKFLKEHTFEEVEKAYKDWCVYLECREQIY